jgi:hypothetical protein
MKPTFEIKTVDASNVDELGFFCYMSKRKEPGYKQKREWLEARFAEGMKIKVSIVCGLWEKAKARDMGNASFRNV